MNVCKKYEKKPISAQLDDNLHKTLKFLSVETGRTMTNLIDEAVVDLLKKYKKIDNAKPNNIYRDSL